MERSQMQTRSVAGEFATREQDGDLYIEGYFAVFNTRYEMWAGAAETVLPGAFKDAVGDDVRALINHDSRLVLGRTSAGTLEIREDAKGLYGRIKINRDDVDAMNLYARVQRGDVNQCSFGFDILSENYSEDPFDGSILWSIERVKLYEVTVATFPAYEETSVSARRRDFEQIQQRKLEAWKGSIRKKLRGELENGSTSVDAPQEA